MDQKCIDMLSRLETLRDQISWEQNKKLVKLWDDKGDYREAPLTIIIKKFREEAWELFEALNEKGIDDIRDEIIDVRNVTEFLWDVLSIESDTKRIRDEIVERSKQDAKDWRSSKTQTENQRMNPIIGLLFFSSLKND